MSATKTSKRVEELSPRIVEAPKGQFHPVLIFDEKGNFSLDLFIEQIKQYEGGRSSWMLDNKDLFETPSEGDPSSFVLKAEKPSDRKRDIYSGIVKPETRAERW